MSQDELVASIPEALESPFQKPLRLADEFHPHVSLSLLWAFYMLDEGTKFTLFRDLQAVHLNKEHQTPHQRCLLLVHLFPLCISSSIR